MSCSCGNKNSNCNCDPQLSGEITFDGQSFECLNDLEEVLFSIETGDNMNNVLSTIFSKLCQLLNIDFSDFAGSDWYSDSPVPGDSLGNDGDFYLRTTNGDVYNKQSGTWGSPTTNLRGTSGTNGTDGTAFRYGSGIPSPSLGNNGDTYVDLASPGQDLYNKVGAAWVGSGIGIKGNTGANGADGTNGIDGTNGADGIDGFSFIQGVGVPDPATGNNGDSYLDSSNGDLYLKGGGTWSVTGNIFSGPVGLEFLFNAAKLTEQTVSGQSDTLQLTFADDVSTGRFDYGNSWITTQQKLPVDADNLSYRGIFNLKVTGVDNHNNNDVTVTVKKNGISVGTFTIPVPAATPDDTIIPLSFATVNAFYATDDIVTVELSTGAGAEYANFVGVAQIGDVFYNVQG